MNRAEWGLWLQPREGAGSGHGVLHSGVEEWRRLGGEKKGRTKPLTECLPFIEKERIQFWHIKKSACEMIHMNSNLQTLVAGVYVCIKLQRRRVSVSVFEENTFFKKTSMVLEQSLF